jgi:hypothetical protein
MTEIKSTEAKERELDYLRVEVAPEVRERRSEKESGEFGKGPKGTRNKRGQKG